MLYEPSATTSGCGRGSSRSCSTQDVLADEPPRVADVELVRPAAGVAELVGARAPAAEGLADPLRRLGREVEEQPLRVAEVALANRVAVAVEVVAVRAVEQVERERADRVDVALAVRQQVGDEPHQARADRAARRRCSGAATRSRPGRSPAAPRAGGGSSAGRSGRGGTGRPAARRRPRRAPRSGSRARRAPARGRTAAASRRRRTARSAPGSCASTAGTRAAGPPTSRRRGRATRGRPRSGAPERGQHVALVRGVDDDRRVRRRPWSPSRTSTP